MISLSPSFVMCVHFLFYLCNRCYFLIRNFLLGLLWRRAWWWKQEFKVSEWHNHQARWSSQSFTSWNSGILVRFVPHNRRPKVCHTFISCIDVLYIFKYCQFINWKSYLCTADIVNGDGKYSRHLRNIPRLILVGILLLMMWLQFLLIEEIKWRHFSWVRRLSICTCFSETEILFRWTNLFSTLRHILFLLILLQRNSNVWGVVYQ